MRSPRGMFLISSRSGKIEIGHGKSTRAGYRILKGDLQGHAQEVRYIRVLQYFQVVHSSVKRCVSFLRFQFIMKLLMIPRLVLPLLPFFTQAWVLPAPTKDCSKFAGTAALLFPNGNTTLVNSTLVPEGGVEVLNVTNALAFCRVFGQVSYGGNDTLNFQLWMPDVLAYEGRFMAVGEYPRISGRLERRTLRL